MSFSGWQLSTISYDFVLHAATYWVFSIYLPKTHPHISACLLSSALPILLPSPSVAWPFSASACPAAYSQDKVSGLHYLLVLSMGNLLPSLFHFLRKAEDQKGRWTKFLPQCFQRLIFDALQTSHPTTPLPPKKPSQETSFAVLYEYSWVSSFWGKKKGLFFLGILWKLFNSFTRQSVHLYRVKQTSTEISKKTQKELACLHSLINPHISSKRCIEKYFQQFYL